MFSRSEKKQIDIQAGEDTALPQAVERVREEVVSRIDPTVARRRPRGDLATEVREIASEIISRTSAAKTGCAVTASAPKSSVSRAIVEASIALAAHEIEGGRKKSMWRWMKGKN